MSAGIATSARQIVSFDPSKTQRTDAALGYAIDFAKRIRDWPALEAAIEEKIEEQAQFVAWWHENVSKRLHAHNKVNADLRSPLSLMDAESQTGIRQQQVSRWAKRLQSRDNYRDLLFGAAYRKAMMEAATGGDNHRAQGTGENEWYTPAIYLEAARQVLGRFDLDPASSEIAQERVQAAMWFSAADNGLSKPWAGKVWLNPPYAQPLIQNFVEKLVFEFGAGNVTESVMLTHNYTDTVWFHLAESAAARICFTRGRIRFEGADGSVAAPTQGQAFFYFGENEAEFREVFSRFGFVR